MPSPIKDSAHLDVQSFVSKKGHQLFSPESYLNICVVQWLVLDACLLHGAFPENTQSHKACCLGMGQMSFVRMNSFVGFKTSKTAGWALTLQNCRVPRSYINWHQHQMRCSKRDYICFRTIQPILDG